MTNRSELLLPAAKEKVHQNLHNDDQTGLISVYLDQIRKQAEKLFENSKGSHDWGHTLRVYRLCERIGKAEGADMEVVRPAAYLHDIGRVHQDRTAGKICHAAEGAKMARIIIEHLPISINQKDNIIHCIRTHRYRSNQTPKTLEARVLFDADKLDSIGAVGIARAFLFAGEVGATLHNPDVDIENTAPYSKNDTGYREYRLKLRWVKQKITTFEGRKIANERHEFMDIFFNQFLKEYEGQR